MKKREMKQGREGKGKEGEKRTKNRVMERENGWGTGGKEKRTWQGKKSDGRRAWQERPVMIRNSTD